MSETENSALNDKNEWSYFVESDKIDTTPYNLEISANEAERNALCKRLDLQDIKNISAKVTLKRNQINKVIEIEGIIIANLMQSCVVTADAVEEYIEESFQAWYADPTVAVSLSKVKRDRLPDIEKAEQPIIEEYDDPEPVVNGKIDLGELVTQHLSLGLNPYPKAPDAKWPEKASNEEDDSTLYSNPFAALKDWKANEKAKAGKKDKKDS